MAFGGFLKQSTATDVLIGPFLDETTGKDAEDGLTLSQADIKLSKNGQSLAQKNDSTAAANDDDGYYNCELDATDTNTVGLLAIICHESGALPVRLDYHVVEEAVYDAMYGADAAGPATPDDVSNIGSGSAGAINIGCSEDNTSGAIIDSVTKVGTPTGTYANIDFEDGVVHSIADVGDDIDWVYGFDVGGARQATEVAIVANVNGNADEMNVKAYDHVGDDWDVIGILPGSGGGSFTSLNLALLSRHTGTGGELGKVYIRFDTTSTTPALLEVDKCLIAAVSTSTSVGYALGSYWIDSAGTSGTEIGTNGTADNPCPWADAITMNGTQALNRFHVANGVTVTLAASAANYTLFGDAWTLALGGQAITSTHVQGAGVTGTSTGVGAGFHDCMLGAVTIGAAEFTSCGFGMGSGTFTSGSAGQYMMDRCHSMVPGSGSPAFNFAGEGDTVGINNRGWTGGASYTLDGDCTLSHEVLAGGGTTITPADADVEIRGITRSVTINLTDTDDGNTIQFVGTTGPITISAAASADDATINLYGVSAALTDNSNGTTNDKTLNFTTMTAILADTGELQTDDVPGLIAALNNISAAEVNAEADTALTDIHLDHLLAADYDPSSKPGTATALLNELVENDGGVSRLTANALEQAPTGGSAPTAEEIVDEWETQSQADPTGFHVNVKEVNGTAQTANDNGADINAILADTNELQIDWANGGRLDLIVDAVLADTGTDGVAISATVANEIADALLKRDWTSVSGEAARSALNALRLLRNKWSITGTTMTVTEEDDSTAAWTSEVDTDSNADPVTGSDPA